MAVATAETVYQEVIKPMPLPERIRIATMVLNDIPPRGFTDYSEEWTDEDLRDLTAYSLSYAAESFGEEDESDAEGR